MEAAAEDAGAEAAGEQPQQSQQSQEQDQPLTLVSWNVAALRSLCKEPRPPQWMKAQLERLGGDVVCLQETKVARDALREDLAVVDGWHAFFAHASPAVGHGGAYSGVATYTRSALRVLAAAAGIGCCAYAPPGSATAASSWRSSGSGSSGKDQGEAVAPPAASSRCPFECARFRAAWEAAVRGIGSSAASQSTSTSSTTSNDVDGEEAAGADAKWSCAAEGNEDDDEEEPSPVMPPPPPAEATDPRRLLQQLDAEGRCVLTDHGAFVLVNVYCPFAGSGEDPSRLAFKQNFQVAVLLRCEALRAGGRAVVLVGDMNAVVSKLDQPDDEFRVSPWVRWMRSMVLPPPPPAPSPVPSPPEAAAAGASAAAGEGGGAGETGGGAAAATMEPLLVDTFRRQHPTRPGAYTCWCNQTGARETNYGRRIDYILASPSLCDGRLARLTGAEVRQEVLGSDHCPVTATFAFSSSNDSSSNDSDPFSLSPFLRPPPEGQAQQQALPSLCAETFPEFRGRQVGLRGFLTRKSPSTNQSPEDAPQGASSVASAASITTTTTTSTSSSILGGTSGGSAKKTTTTTAAAVAAAAAAGKKRGRAPQQQQQQQQQQQNKQLKLTQLFASSKSSSSSAAVAAVSSSTAVSVSATGAVVITVEDDDQEEEEEEEEEQSSPQQPPQAQAAASTNGKEQAAAAEEEDAAAAAVAAAVAKREAFLAAFKPEAPPNCRGHRKPMVLRRVLKTDTENAGRYFYCCALPEGQKGDPNARCGSYIWKDELKARPGGQRVKGLKGAVAAGAAAAPGKGRKT